MLVHPQEIVAHRVARVVTRLVGRHPRRRHRSRLSRMPKPTPEYRVPIATLGAYDAVVALTDDFCRERLSEEYRDLARAMTAALSRKRPSPIVTGQPRTWACAILYLLGQLNFLSDKGSTPSMSLAEIYGGFGVAQSTASAKARITADALGAYPLSPAWTLPSLLGENPAVWTLSVNGLLVDLRDMSREVQAIAFQRGLIPYIPADREQPAPVRPEPAVMARPSLPRKATAPTNQAELDFGLFGHR
jgi:hypothetical protein